LRPVCRGEARLSEGGASAWRWRRARRRVARRRAQRAGARGGLGSRQRGPDRRHLGGFDDRGARRGRRSALVHGRPFARRGLRRARGARRASGRGRGPLGRRQLPPPPRPARDRPWLAPHGLYRALEPAAPHAAADGRRLGSLRLRLDRPAQGDRVARGSGRLGRASELLDRRLRLRVRPPHPVRPARLSPRAHRRCGRRLVRDTGLLPAGEDRWPALRGRRRRSALPARTSPMRSPPRARYRASTGR